MGPHLQQGWSRPRAQRGSSGSRRGTQSCPTYGATPLNVPSRSVRKCGDADESAALVLPRVLSVPTTGSEMAICKVSFIWGAPNFPPCAQGERENQAEFRKSILTAAPPPALLPSGVPGLLMGATRGARRSNQSILKEISPRCSSEGLMLKLKLKYSGHLI